MKKWVSRGIRIIATIFILMNAVAFLHAYNFTHFSSDISRARTSKAEQLSTIEKIKVLFTGISNPKPVNKKVPQQHFETVNINSEKKIEAWHLPKENAKGTVIVFHGYLSDKSRMLDRSDEFYELGYNVLLVDFMGSGGSEGNATTIGFKEAAQVKDCFEYLSGNGEQHIVLFGTSMGAAAIIKSIHEFKIAPRSIIIECPFGTMRKTVAARFDNMNIPKFPMADLLVFWGGIQHGFWAFAHNPQEFAKSINCPVLLLYGEKDKTVSRKETDLIFSNFRGKKELVLFPHAGHENYLKKYKAEWHNAVSEFLEKEN